MAESGGPPGMGGICANVASEGSGGSANVSPYPIHHAGMMLPPPSGTGWGIPTDYGSMGSSFGSPCVNEGIASSSSPPLPQQIGQLPTLMGIGTSCNDVLPSTMSVASFSSNHQLNCSWNAQDTKDNVAVENSGNNSNLIGGDKNNEEEDKKPDISSNE